LADASTEMQIQYIAKLDSKSRRWNFSAPGFTQKLLGAVPNSGAVCFYGEGV
jgi:hypothetical protein